LLASRNASSLPWDDTLRSELAMIVRGAVEANRRDERLGARLLTLADTLDAGWADTSRHPAAFATMAERATPAMAPGSARRLMAREEDRRVRVDRRSLPSSLESAEVRAHRATAGEVEVRVVGRHDASTGCWARAFDRDGTMVAMAPLRSMSPDA